MTNGNWIKWLPEKGTIDSSYGRLIIYADGFLRGFVNEMIKTGGPGLTMKFIKDMGASVNIEIPEEERFLWDDFEEVLDKRIGPFEKVGNLPDYIKDWDGLSRRVVGKDNIPGKLWPLAMIKALMDSAEGSLSERGARSIVGHASWRSGRQFGEVLGATLGWDTRTKLYESVGNILSVYFQSLGWGYLSVKVDEAHDLIAFIVKHAYEVEARGKDSQLTITRNLFEGVGDYLSSLEKLTSKSAEYALGDPEDTRVIVIKMHKWEDKVNMDSEPWKKLVGV